MKMKLGQHKQLNPALQAIQAPKGLTKKLQMNIDEDLHKRFKLACLKQDKEMTEITVELIVNWLKDNE
ncbi:plasmid partition protein ParG [Serratia nevei]|uniref:plasmid partition protein ParG n=1 Tax=Serratia nevei TaxID=2703794 RepID=UPI0027D3138D|nr:plasmid partition protein ParG [Serratia nevei]WMC78463.1 plasmid partition protein ParG [Serratia nevei]WMC83893.1 plasmid partition protein ParG [Serratia nevei]